MYRVVIVEDSRLLRMGLIHTLNWQSMDCAVVGSAADGVEGLELICATQPDIVMTDIRMPGLTGLEMIEAVHTRGFDPAVIIASGYDSFSYAQKAVRLGVVEYLVKPMEDAQTYSAIRAACARVDAQRKFRQLQDRLQNVEQSKIQVFHGYLDSSDDIKSEYTRQALDYIEAHYAEEINVRSIAQALSISESHMSKVFKDTLNTTIGDYLTNYRVSRACELLKDAQNRIYEVAVRCGYQDQRYFSVVFKRIMGMTPNEFRRKSAKAQAATGRGAR